MTIKVLNKVFPTRYNYFTLYRGWKVTCEKSYSSLGRVRVKLLIENAIINQVFRVVTYVILTS